MGSTFFYRKLFIKVSETEVIPFFEAGSSNCYDCGIKNRIGRRSRDWENRTINGKTIVQHSEVLSYVTDYEKSLTEHYNDSHTDSQYTPNCFGWFAGLSIGGKSTSKTTYSDYKNFFMGGIKKAVTIEELTENNIVVSLNVSPYSKEEIESNGLEMKPIVYFNSTQQLIDTINEYTEYYRNVPNCFYLTTVSEYAIERYLKDNSDKRVKKEKQPVTLKEFYVIQCPNSGILAKLTYHGYRYCDYISRQCKIFASLKQAESYLKRMNRPGFTVLKSTNEITVYM